MLGNPPPWPYHSGAFTSYRCKLIFFRGTFLNYFLKPFSMSEFAGLKNIYSSIYVDKKTCINRFVPLIGRLVGGWGVKALAECSAKNESSYI